MKKKKNDIKKIKQTIEELEHLTNLKETTEWAIVKRLAVRYIQNLKSVSFKLVETDAHYLSVRHAELAGQALGIKMLIKMVEESGKRLERMESS